MTLDQIREILISLRKEWMESRDNDIILKGWIDQAAQQLHTLHQQELAEKDNIIHHHKEQLHHWQQLVAAERETCERQMKRIRELEELNETQRKAIEAWNNKV